MLLTLPVRIRNYLKSVPRYKFLMLDTYHPDILYLREQGCEDPWLFFEKERGRASIKVCETLVIFTYSLVLEASELDPHYVHSRSAQDKLTVRHLVTVFILNARVALEPVYSALNMFRKGANEYLTVIALLLDQHSSEKYPRSFERSVT